MKNALLFLSLSAFCLAATAQNYRPLLLEGSYWIMFLTYCDVYAIDRIEVGHDTTIAGLTYKTLFARQCTGSDLTHGFARTNPTYSKLWFRNHFGEETLIMDLDLDVGDFFPSLGGFGSVERIDTIDGRKNIIFESAYVGGCIGVGPEVEPLRFIEGIGPNSGLSSDFNSYFLDCMGVLEENLYRFEGSPWWTNRCELECSIYITSTETELVPTTLDIVVSPMGITLQSNTSEQYLLRIFDPLGRLLQTHGLSDGMTIPLQNLPAGWYAAGLYEQTGNLVLGRKIVIL